MGEQRAPADLAEKVVARRECATARRHYLRGIDMGRGGWQLRDESRCFEVVATIPDLRVLRSMESTAPCPDAGFGWPFRNRTVHFRHEGVDWEKVEIAAWEWKAKVRTVLEAGVVPDTLTLPDADSAALLAQELALAEESLLTLEQATAVLAYVERTFGPGVLAAHIGQIRRLTPADPAVQAWIDPPIYLFWDVYRVAGYSLEWRTQGLVHVGMPACTPGP